MNVLESECLHYEYLKTNQIKYRFMDSIKKRNTGSSKVIFKRLLHTLVSFLQISLAIWGIILPYTVPERHINNKLMNRMWPLRWYFLSLWAVAFQIIYFGIYSVIDLLEIYGQSSPCYKMRDYLHNIASYLLFTLVFPISALVTILFWCFYHWNRELMYPTELDEFIPALFNHMMHTIPVPLSIIYMLMSNKVEPPMRVTLPGLIAFVSVYFYFFLNLRLTQGIWVYVVFDAINEMQIKCLLIFTFVSPIIFLLLGYKLNSLKNMVNKQVTALFALS